MISSLYFYTIDMDVSDTRSLGCRVFQAEFRAMIQDLTLRILILLEVLARADPHAVKAPPPALARHQAPAEVHGPATLQFNCMCACCLTDFPIHPSRLVNPLSFLRHQPQFQVMRQLIQQNAALLPALLQEIGRENPDLLQVNIKGLMCF